MSLRSGITKKAYHSHILLALCPQPLARKKCFDSSSADLVRRVVQKTLSTLGLRRKRASIKVTAITVALYEWNLSSSSPWWKNYHRLNRCEWKEMIGCKPPRSFKQMPLKMPGIKGFFLPFSLPYKKEYTKKVLSEADWFLMLGPIKWANLFFPQHIVREWNLPPVHNIWAVVLNYLWTSITLTFMSWPQNRVS